MPVIEAQCASILVPHDHRHINHERASEMRHPASHRHQIDRICAPHLTERRKGRGRTERRIRIARAVGSAAHGA
jgi:hypothetical protein